MAAPSAPPPAARARDHLRLPPSKPLPIAPRPGVQPLAATSPESSWSRLPRLFRRERANRDSDSDKSFGNPAELGAEPEPRVTRAPSPLALVPTTPVVGSTPSPSPSRFRFALGRAKSEVDLRGARAAAGGRAGAGAGAGAGTGAGAPPAKMAISAPLPRPPTPPPPLPSPRPWLQDGQRARGTAAGGPASAAPLDAAHPGRAREVQAPAVAAAPQSSEPRSPRSPSAAHAGHPPVTNGPPTPTPGDGRFPPERPPLLERATTGQLGVRALAGPWAHTPTPHPGNGTRAPQTPESARSRPSTANSLATGTSGAHRHVPVTPQSAWTDTTSFPSTGSSASFSPVGRHRHSHLRRAVMLQSGIIQDDLLRELRLGDRPANAERPRRPREVLLGALTDEALRALARVAELSPTALRLLTEQRDRLHASRSAWRCDGPTIDCQVVLNDLFYRVRRSASADTLARPRPRSTHERMQLDLVRFLFDAVDLTAVMQALAQPLAPEVRQHLGQHSGAIAPQDAERLLNALHLDPAQRERVQLHVERARQVAQNLSPQSSLNSSETAESHQPLVP